MARIRFLSDQVYETDGPGKGPKFAKGSVLDEKDVGKALGRDVTAEWAAKFLGRWTQRGVAETVDGRTPAAPITAPVPVTPAPAVAPVAPIPLGTAKRGEPTPGLDDGKQVQKTDYATMTRDELDALAAKRSVDIKEAKNKGDVIAALELADESAGK